jgi:hypothetical protein
VDMIVISGIELPVVPRSMLDESWKLHPSEQWPELEKPDGIVDKDSPWLLREAVLEIMLLFRAETGFHAEYSIVPLWSERKEDRAFLWAGEGDGDVPIIGANVTQYRRSAEYTGHVAVWTWFHPDERRKGRLRRVWPYFEHRFGTFIDIKAPRTASMRMFLEKHGVLKKNEKETHEDRNEGESSV